MEAGYLGVGATGQQMAPKRLDAGHGLTVYDYQRGGDAAAT
jgi:3-hydroxyisobutyrate dehydrogenase-like beta-hydroxyacid dehydrogenase